MSERSRDTEATLVKKPHVSMASLWRVGGSKAKSRARTLMKKLEKAGKVVIEHKTVKEKGARKRYVYSLKESK